MALDVTKKIQQNFPKERKKQVRCNNCIKICSDCWENKLTHLRLDPPFSIAKFFYKKGIDDIAIIQRLIYFVYFEVLKEEWLLLFEERFEAWLGGPVLRSVFDTLNQKYEDLDTFFSNVEDMNDKIVLPYLEKIYKEYLNLGNAQIYKRSKNNPWKDTRKELENEESIKKIEEVNIIPFVQWKIRKRGIINRI